MSEEVRMAAFGVCPHGFRVNGHIIDSQCSEETARAWVAESDLTVVVAPTKGNPLEACGPCAAARAQR